jgi:Holliday junction DNA helicase RuvA
VGKKLAERIALELKDKLQAYPGAGTRGQETGTGNAFVLPDSEALAALLALGYQQAEAMLALKGLDEALSTQEKIRLALKNLTRL